MEVTIGTEGPRWKGPPLGGSPRTQSAARVNAEQDLMSMMRMPTRRFLGEGCQRPGTPIGLATNESSVVAAQRMSGGMRAKRAYEQHRKICRWRARAHLEPASASLGRQGGGEARSTGEAG